MGMIGNAAVIMVGLLVCSSCMRDQPAESVSSNSSCQDLASKNQLDKKCAIELAKNEIFKREGKLSLTEIEAHFDAPSRQWIVTAVFNPELPGGHIFVTLGTNGSINAYEMGI